MSKDHDGFWPTCVTGERVHTSFGVSSVHHSEGGGGAGDTAPTTGRDVDGEKPEKVKQGLTKLILVRFTSSNMLTVVYVIPTYKF